jgi:phosphoribosylformylglycinamidine synthase
LHRIPVESLRAKPAPLDALFALLASPGVASKQWIYRQYDHMVRTNTIVLAGMGAGVVRVKGTSRALAMSVDGNGRFCLLDPRAGARLAVAEAARNVACAGGLPIGATNCLNFGNPQRPEIMWQFAEAVAGIGEACRALDLPITGGNVSLYNETEGQPILPTPVLGVVGVIEDASHVLSRTWPAEGLDIVLLGDNAGELGGSEYLKTVHGLIRGVPPMLDLGRERALQTLLVEAAAAGWVGSAHDCADGGFAVALAECCFDSPGGGADVAIGAASSDGGVERLAATLFGESATRAIVSIRPDQMPAFLAAASKLGVPARAIGRTGGNRLRISVDDVVVINVPLAEAQAQWRDGLARWFARPAA